MLFKPFSIISIIRRQIIQMLSVRRFSFGIRNQTAAKWKWVGRVWPLSHDLFTLVRSFSEENLIAVYFDISSRNNTRILLRKKGLSMPVAHYMATIMTLFWRGNYICIWLWRAISLSEISTKPKSPPSCYNQYFRRHDNTAWISLSPRYLFDCRECPVIKVDLHL